MQINYIKTNQQLVDVCQILRESEAIFVDTEFVRQSSYYPQLALVQVTDGQNLSLIDPLEISDLTPLFDLCFNPKIIKVFHSCRQDLEIFYHLCGKVPGPIFDTQIAAALLGFGLQVGYAPLVSQLLGIDLDKSQTFTNWLQRPLTNEQCEYAANDVIFLEKIYHVMKKQLLEQNKLRWLDNDFALLSESSTYEVDKTTVWKKVKGYQRLKANQLVVLQALASFRETQAILKNKIRKYIFSDQLLLDIVASNASDLLSLKQVNSMNHHIFKRWGEQFISVIQQALQIPKEHQPKLPKKVVLTAQQEATTDCLMAICHLTASEHNIDAQYLCQRKQLEKIILNKDSSALLTGWRYEIIGQRLEKFLSGKISLSVYLQQLQLKI